MEQLSLEKPPVMPMPPQPTGWPLLGVLPEWRADPLGLLQRLHREHGDVVGLPLGIHATMVLRPEHVKHVLQDRHLNYQKGFDYERMAPLLGHGLLTSNGEEWKRHRRLAQPAFHREKVAGIGALMMRHTLALVARWRALGDGVEVDLHAELMKLTLQIVGEALFSADLGEVTGQIGEALGEALTLTDERINSVIVTPLWLPTPFNLRYRRRLEVLDRVVRGIIQSRRERPPSDDLLSMLMLARDEGAEASALDDTALRDEVMTMVLAGHETTANALAFTFLLLTQHAPIEARAHESVVAALGDRQGTAADVKALQYVRQVEEEAMRLYPPAWLFGRQAIEDDVIGGYRVPAGSLVTMVPFLTHRDPRLWPEPTRFDPERFAPEQVAARHRFAWYPFSAGPRQCIGNGFALMELQLVLATVLQSVRVEVLEPAAVELDAGITLRPKGGLRARLHLR